MGSMHGFVCQACGTAFFVREGGGFYFDLLHCDGCGAEKSVAHQDLGDIHLRYIKGLGRPYAVARAAMDRRIQAEYQGEPLDRDGYRAAVAATLDVRVRWSIYLRRTGSVPIVSLHGRVMGARSGRPVGLV